MPTNSVESTSAPASSSPQEIRVGPAAALRNGGTVLLGRSVRFAARLRGGGTAFPGLVVERMDPGFVRRALSQLPYGIVVVSGTNGKTTTTKLIVELLRGQGLNVFTNPSGSNFSRGVASALLNRVDLLGRLHADIAVLELDEAHGAKFVADVPPRHVVLLNVFRDQLDRFGEIDSTARLLQRIAAAATGSVVLNRDDRRLREIAEADLDVPLHFFGIAPSLLDRFPGDDELHGRDGDVSRPTPDAEVVLVGIHGVRADYDIEGRRHTVPLRLTGSYNAVNAAAALTAVRAVLGDALDEHALLRSLAEVPPAFGRGERIAVGDTSIELILVKNPAGFRLALDSFDPAGHTTAIAINDHDNDSRDVSWLWDVGFDRLRSDGVALVTGIRAAEMALRLRYDEVDVEAVEPDLRRALGRLLDAHAGRPIRIYCTYTAMLQLRRHLSAVTSLMRIDE